MLQARSSLSTLAFIQPPHNEWDEHRQRVRLSHPNHLVINSALDARYNEAEKAYAEIHSVSVVPTAKAITERHFPQPISMNVHGPFVLK
jgi:hypothetical protein